MTTIRVNLSDSERSCLVDPDELQIWSKALLEELLFEAAKSASIDHKNSNIEATLSFRITHDSDTNAIVIEW